MQKLSQGPGFYLVGPSELQLLGTGVLAPSGWLLLLRGTLRGQAVNPILIQTQLCPEMKFRLFRSTSLDSLAEFLSC